VTDHVELAVFAEDCACGWGWGYSALATVRRGWGERTHAEGDDARSSQGEDCVDDDTVLLIRGGQGT